MILCILSYDRLLSTTYDNVLEGLNILTYRIMKGVSVDRKAIGHYAMTASSITKKGQTTLPKPVREVLGMQPGDRVRYVISGGEVRIMPVRPINRLFGTLRHDGPAVTIEEMEQAVADAACEG